MHAWVAMKQALMVMDVVMRTWARALGLDSAEVMVVLLLAERPGRACSEVAMYSGRTRQQVQRSLGELERRGVVEPVRRSARGRVDAWALTELGETIVGLLQKRMEAWEELIASRVDVPVLVKSLQWMVESLVNRPRSGGWGRGLMVPEVERMDPRWDRAALKEAVQKELDALLEARKPLDLAPKDPGRGARVARSVPKVDTQHPDPLPRGEREAG